MSLKYHIRQMQESDLQAVAQLESECFSQPWKYDDFKDIITNKWMNRVYFVAELAQLSEDGEKQIVGGCMLTEVAGEGDISNVAVSQIYRGNHIATKLLKDIMEFGTNEWNIRAYTLEVRSKNAPAIKLYENAGFVSAGIRPGFYDKPKDDAIIMWKTVED